MDHEAYLSRPVLETGASLVVAGNRLATDDRLAVTASNERRFTVLVSAFGMARLVLEIDGGRFECTPWKSVDDPLAVDIGVASRWTVSKFFNGDGLATVSR